jgi:hypothetical protein
LEKKFAAREKSASPGFYSSCGNVALPILGKIAASTAISLLRETRVLGSLGLRENRRHPPGRSERAPLCTIYELDVYIYFLHFMLFFIDSDASYASPENSTGLFDSKDLENT